MPNTAFTSADTM